MERLELAEVGGEASGSEQLLFQDVRDRRSLWRAARGTRVAVLLLAGASVEAARLALRRAASDTDDLQSKVLHFAKSEETGTWLNMFFLHAIRFFWWRAPLRP